VAKKKKKKNNIKKNSDDKKKGGGFFPLPKEIKKIIIGIVFLLAAIILLFSFFDLSGIAGDYLKNFLNLLFGRTIFILPLIFLLISTIFFKTKYKRFTASLIVAFLLFAIGLSGIFEIISSALINETREGGWLGFIIGSPLLKLFDFWITLVIFFLFIITGLIIFIQLLRIPSELRSSVEESKEPFTSKIFRKIIERKDSFKIENVESKIKKNEEIPVKVHQKKTEEKKEELVKEKLKPQEKDHFSYNLPPIDLLQPGRGVPSSGDIEINSSIIKKTLENFDISVDMAEVNTGPTVTQYTFKPAEGIKLSRITTLSNDLSLALAAHSIRIEAPIPGKSLVGIEIPNKIRAEVRLRDLIEDVSFFDPIGRLTIAMGKDVSGGPTFTHLEKMPHLLIAGATGTGKTIFLNSVILSLLFKNSPKTLRLILVDPKRVEFTHYAGISHLLAPIIHDVNKTYNALKWLVGEMERRLKIMAEAKVRDIKSYNNVVAKNNTSQKSEPMDPMPYIVLVVDELADLMAVKGREIEGGIVRLAQMARAAGIHLVLATQRPSVEVITGLIKANVTSRVTFQVASQIDSRTIIDTSGAEKLIGSGDLLYITGDVSKPRRIQGPFISEKEIEKVVSWIKSNYNDITNDEDDLSDNLEKELDDIPEGSASFSFSSDNDNDPLYEEAKKVVIENKKASASLLQRRLKVGYARAARLIDILEERGVVGPGDGAKPREVYGLGEDDKEDEWHKI